MCCDQKRATARAALSITRANVSDKSEPRQAELRVCFLGSGSLIVKGAYSGVSYLFSSKHPDQAVDARDAEVLTRTGLFRFI
jgi:hypothetical protein